MLACYKCKIFCLTLRRWWTTYAVSERSRTTTQTRIIVYAAQTQISSCSASQRTKSTSRSFAKSSSQTKRQHAVFAASSATRWKSVLARRGISRESLTNWRNQSRLNKNLFSFVCPFFASICIMIWTWRIFHLSKTSRGQSMIGFWCAFLWGMISCRIYRRWKYERAQSISLSRCIRRYNIFYDYLFILEYYRHWK